MRPDCLDALSQDPVNSHSLGFDGAKLARGVARETTLFSPCTRCILGFVILHLIFFPCVQPFTHFHHPSQFFFIWFYHSSSHSLPYGYLHSCFHHPHQFFPLTQEPWGQAAGLRHIHHIVREREEVFVVTIKTGDKWSEEHKNAKMQSKLFLFLLISTEMQKRSSMRSAHPDSGDFLPNLSVFVLLKFDFRI